MNRRQKEILEYFLGREEQVIKALKSVYRQAIRDCEVRIRQLSTRSDLENIQSIVYQTQYQQAIKGQLDGILDTLHGNEFTTISDYLTKSYQDGFLGALYDLHGQGIPLIFPIDQEQVTKAVLNDSKLSKPMYTRLGEDVNTLKLAVRAQISRGIANGSTWNEMAQELAGNMINSPFQTAQYNAMRIARTEGHRIQQQSQYDAMLKAKANGADIIKEWNATLDARTRPDHMSLDGQIREIDQPFTLGSLKAQYPGDFGRPEQDIHCRCFVLQRARWALGEKELEQLKSRAEYLELDKAKDFGEFQEKYLKALKDSGMMDLSEAEQDAISRYISSESYTLNEKLRSGETLTWQEQEWVKNLDSALDKLPSYQGTVYRSVSEMGIEDVDAFVNAIPVGETISSPAYTSSGTEVYDASFPIQYVIQSKNGKDLRLYNPEEAEILFGRNTYFRITKIEGHTIYMEEI